MGDWSGLRKYLTGGDRRSSAQSKRALARVHRDRRRVPDLVALTSDEDWLVSMRALDLLDKLAHTHPEWIAPHQEVFIGPLADSDKWEVQLQIVRALPLFYWPGKASRRVREILVRAVEHPQLFVKAWALDSLATFAGRDQTLEPLVARKLREFERDGRKALAARARQIRARMA